MSLHEINKGVHKNKRRGRVGRGIGSGQGKTSGRGGKGQSARTGMKQLPIFQGGGSPLVRRIPKRGFTNSFALKVAEVNVGDLDSAFDAGTEITPISLVESGFLRRRFDLVKILGNGDVTKKFTVVAHRCSAAAKEKIEQAGGSVTLVPLKVTVAEKQAAAKAARGGAAKKPKVSKR